jgi:hypothetical protein
MENKLLMAVVLTLSLGLILASTSSAQPIVVAQSNTTSSSNNAKANPNGSNQSSPSQPAKPVGTANQLEQMGNNTAFLQGSATVGKKPNLSQDLSKEQNTTVGPSKANMTAQKQPGSASSTNNGTSANNTSQPQAAPTSNASSANNTSQPQAAPTSNASKTANTGSNATGGNTTQGGLAQMNKTASSAAKPANSTAAGTTSSNPNSNNLFAKVGEALKNLFGGGNKK